MKNIAEPRQLLFFLTCWLALILSACGGGAGVPSTTTTDTATLTGVAAAGSPIRGVVALRDIDSGQILATHTDDGSYVFNISGMNGPFLLRVEPDDGGNALYSVAVRSGLTTYANINPLSHLIMIDAMRSLHVAGLDPAYAFRHSGDFAAVNAVQISRITRQIVGNSSPTFRGLLDANDVDPATLDPVRDPFEVGRGLDIAFDHIGFEFIGTGSDGYREYDRSSGSVLAGTELRRGGARPQSIRIASPVSLMIPETSQQMSVSVQWDSGEVASIPAHLVRWSVDDDSLVHIDAGGLLTSHHFTGSKTVIVNAEFVVGDTRVAGSTALALSDYPEVLGIDLDDLPGVFDAYGSYPLYASVSVGQPSPFTTQSFSGDWRVLDDGGMGNEEIALDVVDGITVLRLGKAATETVVRLGADLEINGVVYHAERDVGIRTFVRKPRRLELNCPSRLAYRVPVPCTPFVVYNDGTVDSVRPESLRAVAGNMVGIEIAGLTLNSLYSIFSSSAHSAVTLEAAYAGLSARQEVFLEANPDEVVSLSIQAVSEVAEGSTNRFRVTGRWRDGPAYDLTATARWSVDDAKLATFTSHSDLTAAYILDGDGDATVIVKAEVCRGNRYWESKTCPVEDRISAQVPVTIRYRPPQLLKLVPSVAERSDDFVEEGGRYLLRATGIWDKANPDGSDYTTDLTDEVAWVASGAGSLIDGDALIAGTAMPDSLTLLQASWSGGGGVPVIGGKVLTVYRKTFLPRSLSRDGTYLLGGDGLARKITPSGDDVAVLAPDRFISDVVAVAGGSLETAYGDHPYYLRSDGSIWGFVALGSAGLPTAMHDLLNQEGVRGIYRRVAGIANVTSLMAVGNYVSAVLVGGVPYRSDCDVVALRSEGTLWCLRGSNSVRQIVGIGDVVRMTVVDGIPVAVKRDGSVWSAGFSYNGAAGIGAVASGDMMFSRVLTDDATSGGILQNIVDVVGIGNEVVALDRDGNMWVWGGGALGAGDSGIRWVATQVHAVAGFREIGVPRYVGVTAIRTIDGSLWKWSVIDEPQALGDSANMAYLAGDFAVSLSGVVWKIPSDSSSDYLGAPLPVTVLDATGARVPFVL